MQTIFELKEQAVTDTPLLLFDCALPGGQSEHWSTHAVTIGETDYSARVMRHQAYYDRIKPANAQPPRAVQRMKPRRRHLRRVPDVVQPR